MTSYVVVCTTQTFDVFSIPFKPVKLQDTNFVIQTREMTAFVPSYIFRCCLCLSSLFLQCKPLLNFPINLKAPYKSCHLFQRPCVPSPCQNGEHISPRGMVLNASARLVSSENFVRPSKVIITQPAKSYNFSQAI